MQEICTVDLHTSSKGCLEKVFGFQIHSEGVRPESDPGSAELQRDAGLTEDGPRSATAGRTQTWPTPGAPTSRPPHAHLTPTSRLALCLTQRVPMDGALHKR